MIRDLRDIAPLSIPDANIERERQVTLSVHLPTYGTKQQAVELAERVERELQVFLHRPDLRVLNVLVDGDLVRLVTADDLPPEPEEFTG